MYSLRTRSLRLDFIPFFTYIIIYVLKQEQPEIDEFEEEEKVWF